MQPRLLILTQYYPPELGAPQNRLFELANGLSKLGVTVDVLTAMPNYPQMEVHAAYKGKRYMKEMENSICIYRSWIYVSRSKSIFQRLLNYFSFVFSSLWVGLFKTTSYDYIFCESPPLFLGITAYILKKRKRAQLIFNVSDLWPESAEKLGLVSNKLFLNMANHLEEFLYRKSDFISGQTQGICLNIRQRFPDKRIHWFPNGASLDRIHSTPFSLNWREENGYAGQDFICLYAGIIGHAQGLEVILHSAQRLLPRKDIKFILLGNGPEKLKLQALAEQLQLTNLLFLDAVPKSIFYAIMHASDAAIIPLKKLELFTGAIPSKIFESTAFGKPLILGVEGEAKSLFIDQGKCGMAFQPEDHDDLTERILWLSEHQKEAEILGKNGLEYTAKFFNSATNIENFWKFVSE